MKLRYLAIAAACAAISGQASALTVAQSQAAQLKLFISGSSALQKVIEGVLTQNCGADKTQFKSLATSFGDTSNGASHNIYSCTLTGSDFGAANVGKTMMLVKREAGGSAQGVFPVALNTAIAFMDVATCSDTALTCTGTTLVKPDAGVSDLEPVVFNSAVNRPTAFAGLTVNNSQFDGGAPSAVAEQIFALVVNNTLYAALQADQGVGTGVPTVSSAAFASLYSPGYGQLGLGWTPLLKTGNNQSQINICSRAIGSGTRATAQVQFLQSPNNIVPQSFANVGDNTPGAVKGGNGTGNFFLSEESSSGNVVACVNTANASSAYSIGMVSADRDLTGTGANFVKLDNQTPGRLAAKDGNYPWVFEAFYQVNKSAANLAIAKAFGVAFALPSNIAAIPVSAQNGVMATPENCSGGIYSDWVSPAELAFCSRVSRNQDSRTPLVFIK